MILVLAALLSGAPAFAQAPCDSLCQKRKSEFRYVVHVGKEIYCYWDQKKAETGTDFDALAKQIEQKITTKTTFSEYYRLLRNWASSFHDGHVNVMTKTDLTDLEIYTAPVRVEVLAPGTDHEKVIISQVDKGGEAASVGDQVTSVNGVPIAQALATAADESSSGSTNRMRRFWAGRRLVDVLGSDVGDQPLVLGLLTPTGAAKTVTLARNIEIDVKPTGPAASDTTGIENYSAKVLSGGFGYFRLDGFGGTQDEALISQAMERLRNTRGLVLDLRHNGGGDLSGDKVIERLIDKPVVRYKRSERLSDFILSQRASDNFALEPDATSLFSLWHDLTVKPLDGKRYTAPVVALISPYCFSACDTFVASLKGNGLATIIGEPTGGGTGTPLVFDLPSSPLQFRYSVIRGQTPTGGPIEGVGTEPDPGMSIEPTVDDRINPSHDSQLAKALGVLKSKAAPLAPQGGPAVAPPPPSEGTREPAPVWSQRLGTSPTAEELEMIQRLTEGQ